MQKETRYSRTKIHLKETRSWYNVMTKESTSQLGKVHWVL